MWLGRRRMAIFVAAISKCLICAEAKYCAFEIHGEPKYYVCSRTEYCCHLECCVSPGFQIYHLWYYWLLVIIMFLVCSGGGWWYRYWLQGRYRPSASTVPTRTATSRAQNALRGPTCRAQQARVTYNPARNTVLLHHMWKGPQRNTTPPAYNGAAASSAQFQNSNIVLSDNNCPYYELYGPPPSYETVIAQTRGKLTSPVPLEQSRSNAQTLPMMQNQNVSHCYPHNSYSSLPTRMPIDQNMSGRRNSCGANLEESVENCMPGFGCKNFVRKYDNRQQVLRLGSQVPSENYFQERTSVTGTIVPQNNLEELSDSGRAGDAMLLRQNEFTPDTLTVGNGSTEYSNQSASYTNGQFTHSLCTNGAEEQELNDLEIDIFKTEQPNDENHMRLETAVSRSLKIFTYPKANSSAVSFVDKYHGVESASPMAVCGGTRERYCDAHKYKQSRTRENRPSGSATAVTAASTKSNNYSDCDKCLAQNKESISQLNPSNNVISPSLNRNVQIDSTMPLINIIENYQHYPPTSPAQRSATSTNFESENKLCRSKSLN